MVFKTPFESPQMRRVKNIFFIGVRGVPPERLMSFLRVRACGRCGVAPGVRWTTRVGVFRGTFRGTGHTGTCFPDRDLQNVL